MRSLFSRIFKRSSEDADCKDVRELASDYIEDDISQKIGDKVGRHLEWCRPCSAFVNALKATIDLLRSSSAKEPPRDLRQNIFKTLDRDQKQ